MRLLLIGSLMMLGMLSAKAQTVPSDSVKTVEDKADTAARPTPSFVIEHKPAGSWVRNEISFVSEFISRLNGLQPADGLPVDSTEQVSASRSGRLRELFNAEDVRFKVSQKTYDPSYTQAISLLVEEIQHDTGSVYVTRAWDKLYAGVNCEVKFSGELQTLTLFFKQIRQGRFSSWKVIGANVPFLSEKSKPGRSKSTVTKPTTTDSVRLGLDPSTHETNFLALNLWLQRELDIRKLMPDSLPPGATMARLADALISGKVQFVQPLKTSIFLDSGHGWVMRLDHFVREDNNAGWRISDLYGPTILKPLPEALKPFISLNL